MNIDVELIEKVVKKVLNDVETGSSESEYGYGIFDTMDEAIEASAKAQKEYMNHSMADRQRYVGRRPCRCRNRQCRSTWLSRSFPNQRS